MYFNTTSRTASSQNEASSCEWCSAALVAVVIVRLIRSAIEFSCSWLGVLERYSVP